MIQSRLSELKAADMATISRITESYGIIRILCILIYVCCPLC